ncbi:hypothetical protein C7H79_09210 [Nitrosomonas supralitoralis]|uniref:Uncharacterized protein n=1 Tax=Nitrosomonas supralitoralis TaxID=2116706 RepID=A0A2P7NUW2_9PROT|nr:hypothetical protein C7H79_09210 [Nitrosomonas supralitoralis]
MCNALIHASVFLLDFAIAYPATQLESANQTEFFQAEIPLQDMKSTQFRLKWIGILGIKMSEAESVVTYC